MNNKGFTLVEVLATVAILGIVGGIAMAAVTKYLSQSRQKAYVMMSQSVYEAAENCLTSGNTTTDCDTTNELKDKGYVKDLSNPIRGNADCSGTIRLTDQSFNGMVSYSYGVNLTCKGLYSNKIITWPNKKRIQQIIKEIS